MKCLGLLIILSLLSGCAVLRVAGKDPVVGTDVHRWHRDVALSKLLDRATRSRVTSGNAVRLLVNGVEGFAQRYTNMRSARFIFVKTFLFTDDEEGRRMADALCERARAGVPVVLQYDVKGSVAKPGDIADMLEHISPMRTVGEKRIINQMRRAGVRIVPTNSPGRAAELREWWDNVERLAHNPMAALRRSVESLVIFDYCDHEKYFVTGHEGGAIRAIVGGMNIASEYARGGDGAFKDKLTGVSGWHDVDVEIRGPAAYVIYEEFLKDVKRHAGGKLYRSLSATTKNLVSIRETAASGASVRFIANHPLHERARYTEELYRILLRATPGGEPIFIASPYFAPSRRIRDAIIAHAKRGGTVTVLTNSMKSNNHPILSEAAHYAALQIMKETENVHLYEWIPQPERGEQTIHHKVASFGRFGPVVVGSFNLDAQSAIHNTEDLVVIDEPVFRESFHRLTKRDLGPERSKRVRREDLESEAIARRIRAFLIHEMAWYWL
jgi:phosphatidylserine/phosphatidylglycerophosphate/cardiolipin synthase-like enzyme